MPSVDTIFDAVAGTMAQVKGGYAVAVLIKGVGVIVFRDPHGIRYSFALLFTSPLCFGAHYASDGTIDAFAAASESVAIQALNLDRDRIFPMKLPPR